MNPSCETKFSGANGDGGILIFPCSADHEQDWQPYPVDPHSAMYVCILLTAYGPQRARLPTPLTATLLSYLFYFLKKNQNAPRPSEHPPVMGGKCQNV